MTTEKQTARITGLLYVIVIICAGFSQGYVRGSLFLPDDPTGTYNAITTQEGLFRLGLVTDLIAFLCDAAISILLYQLLKPAGKTLAMIAAAFRLLAHPAIATLNLLNHYMVLEVIGNPEMMATFAVAQREAAVTLLMTAHQYGYLIAGAFFGIHCLLLGILLYKSSLFPKVFGVLLVFAAVGYLMESFGDLLFPGNEGWLALTVGVSAAVGEVSLAIYMLVKGVKG